MWTALALAPPGRVAVSSPSSFRPLTGWASASAPQANIGQVEDFEEARKKALKLGAKKVTDGGRGLGLEARF